MTLPVRFTPTADAEFLAVITHIGADSPSAAYAFMEKALHALSRLGAFPASGRAVPEYPALPFREATLALSAVRLSLEHALPMADSVILATARAYGATLWTQDADFEGVPGVRYVAKNSGPVAG